MNDQLKQAIIDGNEAVALAMTQALVATGATPREILDEALLPGMEVVGARMREGECFIPEVLLSARVMQACLDLLRPHMAAGEEAGMGTVVIGTVEGDLHDIGKNLVGMLLSGRRLRGRQPRHRGERRRLRRRGQGAPAEDRRHERPAHDHAAAHGRDHRPAQGRGPARAVKVMVGGAPVTAAYAAEIGADGYGANAGMAVERAKELVG